MKKSFVMALMVLVALGCSQKKSLNSKTIESDGNVAYLAFNCTALKKGISEFKIIQTEIDTLLLPNSPLPFGNEASDNFRIHIVDNTRRILFGSESAVKFSINEDGDEIGYLKFYCTVPQEASEAIISFEKDENLWKQIKIIDL